MRSWLVALVASVSTLGTYCLKDDAALEHTSRRVCWHGGVDASEDTHENDASSLLQMMFGSPMLASEEKTECHLLLPLLGEKVVNDGELQSLCQESFSESACQEVGERLAERPWSEEAVGEACERLAAWPTHANRLESLLLLSRSSMQPQNDAEIRKRLDTSLKRKGTTTSTTTTIAYRGEAAKPYKKIPSGGKIQNKDFEDATVWRRNSSKIKVTGRTTSASTKPKKIASAAAKAALSTTATTTSAKATVKTRATTTGRTTAAKAAKAIVTTTATAGTGKKTTKTAATAAKAIATTTATAGTTTAGKKTTKIA